MELEIIRKVKVNPKTLLICIPNYEDNVFQDLTRYDELIKLEGRGFTTIESIEDFYPQLFGRNRQGKKYLVITIDVETGQVVNWPKNSPYSFFDVKIVDEGEYILLDKNGEQIAGYSGYVPACVGYEGYGDYLEFEIDSASNIPEWEFTQKHLNEFMKKSGNELYKGF